MLYLLLSIGMFLVVVSAGLDDGPSCGKILHNTDVHKDKITLRTHPRCLWKTVCDISLF